MRRRIPIIATVVVVVAAAVYAGYWLIAADLLREGIARWAAERRAEGWTAAWREPEIGGFPFALSAVIAEPHIAAPGAPVAWDWRGPTVTATARPWSPRDMALSFPGAHRVAFMSGAARREFAISAGAATARLGLADDGRPRELVARFSALDVRRVGRPAAAVSADSVTLSVTRREPLPARPSGARAAEDGGAPPGMRIGLAVARLILPEFPRPALGREIRSLDADIELLGVVPPGGSLVETLTGWRDRGGTFEIRRLRLSWGGLEFDGDGTVTLDGDMQPMAAMTGRIAGYRELVDALAAAGYVRRRDTMIAKLALSMMARATPGGPDRITVPVTLQDRRISVGPLRLARLPRLVWD